MPLKTRALLSMLLALSIESQATVSFLIQADLLTDRNGVPIPNDAMVLLVASTTDSTFGYPWTSSYIQAQVGARLQPDGDDYIVYRTHIDTGATGLGPGVLDVATGGLRLESIPNWTPGDPLMLMWFPTLNSSTSVLPWVTVYGAYSNPMSVDGSGPWRTPPNGTSNAIFALYTRNGTALSPGPTASNPAQTGMATQIAAPLHPEPQPEPEPTASVLAGLGSAVLLGRRRRK